MHLAPVYRSQSQSLQNDEEICQALDNSDFQMPPNLAHHVPINKTTRNARMHTSKDETGMKQSSKTKGIMAQKQKHEGNIDEKRKQPSLLDLHIRLPQQRARRSCIIHCL